MKIAGLHILVALVYIFGFCAVSVGAYWLLYDTAIPIRSVSVQLLNEKGYPQESFNRGDLMLVDRENCVEKTLPVVVTRELIRGDGFIYTMPSNPSVLEAGCKHTINAVVVPNHATPGKYEYWVTLQYTNNPLTTGQLLLKVPELTVLP